MRFQIGIYLLLCSILSSCGWRQQVPVDKETILCEVYGKRLLYSEVAGVIPSSLSSTDSTVFIKNYVDRWIKDALLLRQAELNVQDELNVTKLVEAYRESLLLVNYEKQLYETQLEMEISPLDMATHFEEHKDDYLLSESVAKIALFKPVSRDSKSRKLWNRSKTESLKVLEESCAEEGAYCFSDTSIWLPLLEINTLLPQGDLTDSRLKVGDVAVAEAFLHIFELYNKGEIAPIEYVDEEIRRSILFERRSDLLKRKRNELYEKELDKSNVKNYVQK